MFKEIDELIQITKEGKNKKSKPNGLLFLGEWWDLNPRPPGPQPGALTSWATPTIDNYFDKFNTIILIILI